MKITPSNQTLILAGERRAPGNLADGSSGGAIVPGGTKFQRLAVAASRWDTTVSYVMSSTGDSGISPLLHPVDRYAQIQRMTDDPSQVQHIDVYA